MVPLSVYRSGRANESVTQVLHTERPKTLPSIGLWVTTPLKRLLQLLLHRPLPAAAAPWLAPPGTPAGGSPDGSAPQTLQVFPQICPR